MSAAIDYCKVEYVVLGKVFYAANVAHFWKIDSVKVSIKLDFLANRKKYAVQESVNPILP